MIIGNNNNNNANPLIKNPLFNNKFKQNTKPKFTNNSNFKQSINNNPYKDIYNKKEMNERSYEILKQRYDNGLISIEEFSKKCEQISKRG